MQKRISLWTIICLAFCVLCSGIFILSRTPNEVYAEEGEGHVVFYEISTASTASGTYYNRAYIVLKNIGDSEVDMSDYSLWTQSSKSSSAFVDATLKFKSGTIIAPDEYFIIVQCNEKDSPESPNASTSLYNSNLPDFIKNMPDSQMIRESNSVTGKDKTYLLYKQRNVPAEYTTKVDNVGPILNEENETFMNDTNVSDMVGVGTARSYLYDTQTVANGQSIRRVGYTGNNKVDFEIVNNDYISEEDNTLLYLTGTSEPTISIASAKLQADSSVVSVRAKVTSISDRMVTIQDSGSAMLVEVLGSDALTVADKDEAVFTGNVVTKSGQKVLQVTNDESGINVRSSGNEVDYVATPLWGITDDASKLNMKIALRGAQVYSDNVDKSKYIMSNGTKIVLNVANGLDAENVWSIQGILRFDGTNWSIDCGAQNNMLGNYTYGMIAAVRDMQTSSEDIAVTGYLTYYSGSSFSGYLQDSSGAIGLRFKTYNRDMAIGDYITVVGNRGASGDNQQLQNVEVIAIDKENAEPKLTAVEYSTSAPQYDNMVTLGTVEVNEVLSKKNYMVTYKGQDVELTFDQDYTLYVGDPLEVKCAIPTQNGGETQLRVLANNADFVKRLSCRVIDVVKNYADGDTVSVRGFVTYIDRDNQTMVIQSEGYGILVNNVTNIDTFKSNDIVQVDGVYHKPAGAYKYISATNVATTTNAVEIEEPKRILKSEKDGEDFSVIDETYQSLLVSAVEVQVVSVNGRDIVVQDKVDGQKNTLTIHTTFDHNFDENDVLTVSGVIASIDGKDTLVVYDQNNIKSVVTDIKTVVDQIEDPYQTIQNVYIRGTVNYIQYSSSGKVSEMIIQDANNVGIYVNFEDSVTTNLELWDTVTVNGDVYYDGFGRLVIDSSASRLMDIVVNESPITPSVVEIDDLSQDDTGKYNGLYVTLDNMKIEGYDNGLLKLTNGTYSLLEWNIIDLNNLTTVGDVKVGDTVSITGTLLWVNDGYNPRYELYTQVDDNTFSNVVRGKISVTFYEDNEAWQNGTALQTLTDITRGTDFVITVGTELQDGYQFKGWVIAPYNDQSTKYHVGDTVRAADANMTIVGIWVQKFSITFDCNGGNEMLPIEGEAGDAVETPNDPTRDGYHFAGWYADPDFKEVYVFDTIPDHDITVYAKWTKDNTVLIIILCVIIGIVAIDAVIIGIVIYKINKKMKIIQGY